MPPYGDGEIRAGEKVVALAATPEAMTTQETGRQIRHVVIQAKKGNTTTCYLGNATTQKLELSPGESIGLVVLNLNKIYVKVGLNGEGVNYFGIG